jgi:hypothetical protein
LAVASGFALKNGRDVKNSELGIKNYFSTSAGVLTSRNVAGGDTCHGVKQLQYTLNLYFELVKRGVENEFLAHIR